MQIPPIGGPANYPPPPSQDPLVGGFLVKLQDWRNKGTIDSAKDLLAFITDNKGKLKELVRSNIINSRLPDIRQLFVEVSPTFERVINQLKEIVDGRGDQTAALHDLGWIGGFLLLPNKDCILKDIKGLINSIDLLNSEKELIASKLQELDSQAQGLLSVVTLYKALGGGWTCEEE